eukprot:jgi/Chrzof1/5698/Cz16g12070.t1
MQQQVCKSHVHYRTFQPICQPRTAGSSVRCRRCLKVAARQRSGPTGLNVEGYRPTSAAGWEMMKQALKDANLKVMSPQEVLFAQERGVTLLDVRPEGDYLKGHLPGAINVQFYQSISGWSPMQIARRVGYAMFGVLDGTEVNPNFAQEVAEVVNKQKGAILYCSQGGSLESTASDQRGFQTRSLIAAHDLICEGFTDIHILKGGYSEWLSSGREIEVFEEVEPAVEEQQTTSAQR